MKIEERLIATIHLEIQRTLTLTTPFLFSISLLKGKKELFSSTRMLTRKLIRFVPVPFLSSSLRAMSHNLRDKELADEKRYANEQDEEKLRVLREDMKKEPKKKREEKTKVKPSSPVTSSSSPSKSE